MHIRLWSWASLAIVVVVTGCPVQTGGFALTEIAGTVTAGAPVVGATVSVFPVDEAGKLGEALELTKGGVTDNAGAFAVEITANQFTIGPVVVCALGGSYVEASTATVVEPTDPWCARTEIEALAGDVSGLLVTPWTSLHSTLTSCMTERGDKVTEAPTTAAALLNNFLGAEGRIVGFDVRSGTPLNLVTTTATGLGADAWHGLLLAGLAETAKQIAITSGLEPGLRVTSASLLAELVHDLDDGVCKFDGQGRAGALKVGNLDLTADTLRGAPQGLASGILRFLEGQRNASTIPAADVVDIASVLAGHRSALFGQGGVEGEGEADLDKPVVTFTAPDAGSTRGGVVRIEVTAVDASELPTLAFSAPAQATFTAATPTCTTAAEGTTCTLVGNLNTSLAPVVDGPVVVTVHAVDAAGNTQDESLTFTANNSLPAISVTAPQADAVVDGIRTISATVTDADGIQSLTVDIPGVGLCSADAGAAVPDVEPATGTLSCSWDTNRSPEGPTTLVFHAVDGAGQTAELPHTVTVDNDDLVTINGFVDVGAPVVGATVTVLDWVGRVRGTVLGTATTDEAGAFSVSLDDQAHGAVLLVVTGGTFIDLATGGTFPIAEGQELTAAVGALAPGDVRVTNVNAWTTLAAARAQHTPSVADDGFAITTNTNLFSQHLRRVPLGAPFSAAAVRSADLTTETVTISDQRAVLALSQAALSRLAAEFSVRAGVAVGSVTIVELVHVLAADLDSDPLLDGQALGSVLTIGPANAPLSSLTTRFDLAAALDRYLTAEPLQGADVTRNRSGITRTDALNGRLYEAIAEDNRGDLYPDEGRPFDVDAPTIDLSFGGVNQSAVPGASLRGTVQINGLTDDEASEVVSFGATLTVDGAFIADDDRDLKRLRVFLGTDILPNAADAADACANADDAADVSLLIDAVCVCAIAEDAQANIAERILCFTRPVPTVDFASPSPSNSSSVTGATTIAARVTTGFDLDSFNVTGATAALGITRPTTDTLQFTIPTSFVDEANKPDIVVGLTATDIAGRTVTDSLTFTRPVPAVEFIAPTPANNASVTGAAIIAARATTGYDLNSFSIIGATSTLPLTRPTSDTLQFTVPTSFVDQVNKPNIVVGVAATDITGRSATPVSVTITRAAPTTTVTSPGAGSVFSAGQQVQLSAEATSGYDLQTCTVTLTSSPARTRPTLPAVTRSGTSCSFSSAQPVTALDDATWTLTMNATDVAGRVAAPATRSFVVDDTAPAVTGLTLAGVTRTINTVAGERFIAADNPAAPAPRLSTYTATVTAIDNFAVSRVVFRTDAPNGADILTCVDGVAGACASPTAVLVGGQLRSCTAGTGCTIGGTRTGDSYAATIVDDRNDGARSISVEVFDTNGNQRTDGASVVLNKDSVAPVFTWKSASQQDGWHDMAPTAGVQLCRTLDSNVDFRSSCLSKPTALVLNSGFVGTAFFVGSTPTTPINTMHVWRSFIRGNFLVTSGVSGVVLPTATSATVGDGTANVRFQAGTSCPAAATLTKSKVLTNGGFALNLATDDLGFDFTSVNNARVCIRAVPVDGAGNEGAPADIFVKWDTVDPPLNVLVNPPDDADPLVTEPFSEAAADARTFVTGGKRVSMFHVFISNPYTFTEKVKLTPTADLVVDIADTLTQHTQRSNLRDRWPGNAIVLQSPGSNIGRGPGNMAWTTTGLAASDDDADNQIFVKVTRDSATTPVATKISDTPPAVGVITRTNNNRLDKTMTIEAFRFFSVSSTGVVNAELTPDAAGFITVPAAAANASGLGFTTTASVVVAVAVGRVATGTSYQIAAPSEAIPVMLRGGSSTGVNPDITTTRFVVTRHPILNAGFGGGVDVEGLSGFHVHSLNGDGSSGSPLQCSSSGAANLAECRFYKRWFELEEFRLVWNVGDGTTLKKVFTLSTKDAQNQINTFSNTTALVPMHPFWAGFEGAQQELRVSDAPAP